MESRFYCPKHFTPVEFSIELEGYTCGQGCEKVYHRRELLIENDVLEAQERISANLSKVEAENTARWKRKPMGEFL